jgi:hypothetical protein
MREGTNWRVIGLMVCFVIFTASVRNILDTTTRTFPDDEHQMFETCSRQGLH